MHPAFAIVLLALIVVPITASLADGINLFVSNEGNDQWSGRLPRANEQHTDGPLATVAAARDSVRRLRAAGLAGPSVATITIEKGNYTLSEPLTLLPQDSNITFKAADSVQPVLSGGVHLKDFTQRADGAWIYKLPASAHSSHPIDQLWVNGRRARPARFPADGYMTIAASHQEPQTNGLATPPVTITVAPDALAALPALTAAQIRNIRLVAFHNWDNTIHPIESIDVASGKIVFAAEAMKHWNPIKAGSLCYLENLPSALIRPGGWARELDGTVVYRPQPGETASTAQVVAPILDHLVAIAGTEASHRVENVIFDGLSFQHSSTTMPWTGFNPAQAAAQVSAAVVADYAQGIAFENCEVAHIGTYGLWFRKGCTQSKLQHCQLHDLGAGAVRIGECRIAEIEAERTGHITVDNCIISQGGRIYPCAAGVFIAQSADNAITHNEIADLFYTGISAGWTWGYGPSLTVRNHIAYNHIHHLGWRVMSDMGGVYTLGISPGTVVEHNVIHDVYSAEYGGWGLYTDEGSSNIILQDNLVYHNGSAGFHQHYGQDNIVRNNIFALDHEGEVRRSKVEDHTSFQISQNIFLGSASAYYTMLHWNDKGYALDHNLYWSIEPDPITFGGMDMAAWKESGRDIGSLIADPQFVDAAHCDFRLKPGSPAAKIGFKEFDPAQAGVYGDASWRSLAAAQQLLPVDSTSTGPIKQP